jgi:DinB superfamily
VPVSDALEASELVAHEMISNHAEQLSALITEANGITDETLGRFGSLSAAQLNWMPGADRWSVAQCFDHLSTANATYFPTFERVLNGEKKKTFWESLPGLPAFWGKMVLKAVSPETEQRRKAPKIFHPSTSLIDGAVIHRFVDQQNQVVAYMKATEHLDIAGIIITSPVSSVITYSLLDAFRIIIAHEKRHFLQATRVTEMDGFPK